MAIGQTQQTSMARTGQRPGGGVQRATPYRTTPLPRQSVTPINRGRIRQPAGFNMQSGSVRADRGRLGVPMNAGRIPNRTRALRPLVVDRLPRSQMPSGGTRAEAINMPRTMRAITPQQPQPRGPYSPTPGTTGPSYPGKPLPSGWEQVTMPGGKQPGVSLPGGKLPYNPFPNAGNIMVGGPWRSPTVPTPMPTPTPPIYGGGSGPIYGGGGWDGGRMPTVPGGYDGSGINPGGMYTKPAPNMGINPRVDPTTGETIFW